MRNVQEIIRKNGGLARLADGEYIKLEAPGYMPLVIEHVGVGPRGLPMISVAHYYTQNGDAMRDPDIEFEIGDGLSGWRFLPVSYRQDGIGMFQRLVFLGEDGRPRIRPEMVQDVTEFAAIWDRNIGDQGFVGAENVARRVSVT